jgi:hypothetical protein
MNTVVKTRSSICKDCGATVSQGEQWCEPCFGEWTEKQDERRLWDEEKGYTPDDISWAIGEWTESEYSENWGDFTPQNKADGSVDGIAKIPNGKHSVCFSSDGYQRMYSNVIRVINGKVHMEDMKEATAHFLNQTGKWHTFIEIIDIGDCGHQVNQKPEHFLLVFLGS